MPDPSGQVLAGWVFEPLYVVQVAMVDRFFDGLERAFDVGEIHDPAEVRIEGASHVDFDAETMPVQAPALVSGWDVGQLVCRLDREYFENLHLVP